MVYQFIATGVYFIVGFIFLYYDIKDYVKHELRNRLIVPQGYVVVDKQLTFPGTNFTDLGGNESDHITVLTLEKIKSVQQ